MFFTFPIILAGCAGMNSSFDCNVTSGGRCVPMMSINEMVNRGAFQRTKLKPNSTIDYSKYSNRAASSNTSPNPSNADAANNHLPLRINESVQQIWIAPYEDASGIYHDTSLVYVVAQKGHWMGRPSMAVVEDEQL